MVVFWSKAVMFGSKAFMISCAVAVGAQQARGHEHMPHDHVQIIPCPPLVTTTATILTTGQLR